MGDGCVTKKYFAYYNKEKTLLKNYEKDITILFNNPHIIRGEVNSGTSFIMVCNNKIISFLFSLLNSFKSKDIRLPLFINSKDLQRNFLKSFYDDEGCVALRIFAKTNEIKRNLTLSSNSLILLQEIKQILHTEFNITSNKIIKYIKKTKEKKFINYVLSITGRSNFEKFKDSIGFNHPDKKEKLEKIIHSYIRNSKI